MKKTTLTTLFLMAALTLSGCHNNQPAPAPQPPEDDPAPPVVSTVKPPQYYFIASHFMGSYDAEGWHSAGDVQEILPASDGTEIPITARTVFTAGEIASAEAYQLYTLDKFLGTAEEIIWPTTRGGLSDFGFDSDSEFSEEASDVLQEMTLPVIDEMTSEPLVGYGRLALPADFTDTPMAPVTMPYYNAHGYFSLNDTIDFAQYPVLLATSALHNPLPQKVQVLYQLSDELEAAFAAELTALGLADAPVHLTDYYAADFDHDGQEESLLILQTPISEAGYPLVSEAEQTGQSGAYALVAYIDDLQASPEQTPQILYSWNKPYTADVFAQLSPDNEIYNIDYYRQLTFLGAYDLNGNSALEFCLNDQQWEGGSTRIYTLDDQDQYRTVLVCSWGS